MEKRPDKQCAEVRVEVEFEKVEKIESVIPPFNSIEVEVEFTNVGKIESVIASFNSIEHKVKQLVMMTKR